MYLIMRADDFGNDEEVDSHETREGAEYLLGEYRLADRAGRYRIEKEND